MYSANFFNYLGLYSNMGGEASPGTPKKLANEMLDKLPSEFWSDPEKTFLDPSMTNGMFYFLLVERLFDGLSEKIPDSRKRIVHILTKQVWGYEMNKAPFEFVKKMLNQQFGIGSSINIEPNLCYNNILDEEIDMKFDVVVMNPPYQIKVGPKKTEPIWHKFVMNIMEEGLNDEGYLFSIHPTGWRAPVGRFSKVKELYQRYNTIYLSMNSFNKGKSTFGVGTAYDVVLTQKVCSSDNITEVVSDSVDEHNNLNLSGMSFIPDGLFEEFGELIAKDEEEKANVLYSRSAYGSDKSNTSHDKVDNFVFPCIYTVPSSGIPRMMYSNTNNNGHFGISKVIWSNGAATVPIIDDKGEFGITQFSYAICDEPQNLPKIKKALESERFLALMKKVSFTAHKYNYKVISCFKKDWWKSFQ